jgi:thiol-disulfide isomerase/thioredoxin
VARVIQQEKGVVQARFEKHKAELFVSYQAKEIQVPQMVQRISEMGFVAIQGAGKGAYVPPVKFAPHMDVRWISKQGELVKLEEHLASGKVTIFDFSATWCGPCKDVDHSLLALLQKYRNLAVRKINIVDWDRPIARQYMSQISQLPYLIIFDRLGKRHSEIVGRQLETLQNTVQQLAR